MGCFKKCLRPSRATELLEIIFSVVGTSNFRWDTLKTEIPDLPRQPPVSLIDSGMLISKGKDRSFGKGTHQIWTVSQDVAFWIQHPEPDRKRRNT